MKHTFTFWEKHFYKKKINNAENVIKKDILHTNVEVKQQKMESQ